MDGKKDIFSQFQDRQSAWDETPPASAWDRLESRLDAEPSQHPGRPWKPFILPGLGMFLLFAFLGWGLINGATKPDVPQILADTFNPYIDQNSSNLQGEEQENLQEQEEIQLNGELIASTDGSEETPNERLAEELTDEYLANPYLAAMQVGEPNFDSLAALNDDNTDLGNPALEPLPYQRLDPGTPLENILPDFNGAAYNYDNTTLNPGNMVITNTYGNILDTVKSISQYHNAIVEGVDNPGFLQMNATRNDISYGPRGGHRNYINPSKLEHFNWLLGSWREKGLSGGAFSYEEWEMVDAFNFEGRGFLIVNGDTLITEKMRIEQRGENVYYIAALDTNHAPMRFRLRSNTPGEAVFKNPGRGFPNEIILRQSDDGNMETILNNGKTSPRKREEVIRNLKRE